MGGADGSAGRASGLFERALGEMIDGTGQPVGGLNEQFERVVLKRVCAYSSGAKSCGDGKSISRSRSGAGWACIVCLPG